MIAIVFMFWVSFLMCIGVFIYWTLQAVWNWIQRCDCEDCCHKDEDKPNSDECQNCGLPYRSYKDGWDNYCEGGHVWPSNEDTADKKVERCPGCGCDDDCFCECEYCPKCTKNEGQES